MVNFEACFAGVPGKQLIQFPWAGGNCREGTPSLGTLEGCLAVTVPGMNSTARHVLFLITFPVAEILHFISRL